MTTLQPEAALCSAHSLDSICGKAVVEAVMRLQTLWMTAVSGLLSVTYCTLENERPL
jgi:hypothetical protein